MVMVSLRLYVHRDVLYFKSLMFLGVDEGEDFEGIHYRIRPQPQNFRSLVKVIVWHCERVLILTINQHIAE